MENSSKLRSCGNRRGAALLLVLLMTVALAALAASAIFMTSSGALITRHYDREREFRYAAEAALAIGKSRLAQDAAVSLPDSGYLTLLADQVITGADGIPVPGVKVNLYGGRTGSTSGQFGSYASLVAEARDGSGARYVRRLELAEENFAKYLNWSNTTAGGCYAAGEVMRGPIWSNSNISICTGSLAGARFTNDVGTVGVVVNKASGVFDRNPRENLSPINLPSTANLAKLANYATGANFAFNAPTSADASGARLRIEFVAIDLNADGDSVDANEGFFRAFEANSSLRLRADYFDANTRAKQCGDWHNERLSNGQIQRTFWPYSVHNNSWFEEKLEAGGMGETAADAERAASFQQVMSYPGARCFLAGDPHLVAVEREGLATYTSASRQRGGSDTTFTATPNTGRWLAWPGTSPAALSATPRSPAERPYLFPLYRGFNSGTRGVIHVTGTVGISGVLRDKLTLYSTANVVFLDDLTYATDPASGKCIDMLGVIAAKNAVIADNALNTPQRPAVGSGPYVVMDNARDFYLHAILMTLDKSLLVENVGSGPSSVLQCGGTWIGRGCIYQTGGIVASEGSYTAVSYGGGAITGFLEQPTYDRCAINNAPPYFPTTGRFEDNRYYEIDPVRFSIANLFSSLRPTQ